MHIKLYKHDNLSAAVNSSKVFPETCNFFNEIYLQSKLRRVDYIFIFSQISHGTFKKFHMQHTSALREQFNNHSSSF